MSDVTTLPTTEKDLGEDQQKAPMWKVLFHNDDVTTMEFVMYALMRYFGHDAHKAYEIMMSVHTGETGLAGAYPQEIAEFKQEQVISAARGQKFPLKVTIEPDV